MSDPHKGKVQNGHGIWTSKLSVSLVSPPEMHLLEFQLTMWLLIKTIQTAITNGTFYVRLQVEPTSRCTWK